MTRHVHKVHLILRDDFPGRTRKGKTVCGQAIRMEFKPTKRASGSACQESVHSPEFMGERHHIKTLRVDFRPEAVTCAVCLQHMAQQGDRDDG